MKSKTTQIAQTGTKGAVARREAILLLLRKEGFISTLELANRFEVSDMTIRRDILDLEQDGLVRRVHGGASAFNNGPLLPTDFIERSQLNFNKKKAIAKKAVEFVSRGDIIAIDAGTTTLEIARLLPNDSNLTVVTHSLPVVNELILHPNIKLNMLGGELHIPTQSFSSLETASVLSNLRFTIFFLSAGSIRDNSIFCATPYEAVMKKALIDSSEKVVLVSDSTKFSSNAMVKVCDLDKISILITDDELDKSFINLSNKNQDIDLITVATNL